MRRTMWQVMGRRARHNLKRPQPLQPRQPQASNIYLLEMLLQQWATRPPASRARLRHAPGTPHARASSRELPRAWCPPGSTARCVVGRAQRSASYGARISVGPMCRGRVGQPCLFAPAHIITASGPAAHIVCAPYLSIGQEYVPANVSCCRTAARWRTTTSRRSRRSTWCSACAAGCRSSSRP